MAAENLGSVSYTVKADVQELIDSTKKIEGELDKQQSKIKKTIDELDRFNDALKQNGRSIDANGNVIDKNGKILDTHTAKYNRIINKLEDYAASSKTAAATSNALGRNLGQSGIQIGQFANQVAGGQNAVLALSQQLPDLLVGFGALGGVIGGVVAVAGALALGLGATESEADKLNSAIEQQRAILTLTSDGVVQYTEKMEQLRRISEGAFLAQQALAAQESANIIKSAAAIIGEAITEQQGTFQTFPALIREAFGSASQEVTELQSAIKSTEINPTIESFNRLDEALQAVIKSSNITSEKGLAIVNTLGQQVAIAKEAFAAQEKLTQATEDQAKAIETNNSQLVSLVASLELERVRMEEGEAAARKLAATRLLAAAGADEATTQAIELMIDNNEKIKQSIELEKQRTAEIERAEQAELRRAEARGRQGEQLAGQLGVGSDPVAKLQAEISEKAELLQAAKDQELITEQEFLTAKEQLTLDSEQRMQAAREESFRQQSAQNELLLNSVDALGQAGANAITGVLTGTQTLSGAMKALGRTILSEVVKSFVQVGIQYLKNQIIGQAATAASTATQVAAMGTIAAAAAPAAAFVSLATAGANSVPATTGIATTFATAQALSLAGGRQFGGAYGAGNYEVAERGTELILPNRGNPILASKSGGEVISNKDLVNLAKGAQQQAPVINIVNNTPATISQTTQGNETYITIDQLLDPNSDANQAVRSINNE